MRVAAAIVALAATGVAAAAAFGAGIAPGTMTGGSGVADARAGMRYVAVRAGAGTTVLAVRTRDGMVARSRYVPGRYGVPVVTFNADAGGLSANGRTLVLEGVRSSQQNLRRQSRLLVLQARGLKPVRRITLRGDLSFDTLSPDGRRLFLIQHAWQRNVARYAVRVYDLRTGRLATRAVVDKDEPEMAGFPMRRTTGPDARWVYTLYTAPGGAPFVHALDTVGVRAVCIDLPSSDPEAVGRAHLEVDAAGRRLNVVGGDGRTLYSVDLRTFRVTKAR